MLLPAFLASLDLNGDRPNIVNTDLFILSGVDSNDLSVDNFIF
ncbi:MAG: hypothetical protein AB4206_09910 [Xenococcaceae cyanobacterium]